MPKVPKQFVKPLIITGVDALGRGNDLAKLDAFLAGIHQTLGPEAVAKYINPGEYLSRRAAALGIDIEGLIRDEESIAADQNQQMQMMMAQKLGPAAITQIGKGLTEGTIEMPAPEAGGTPGIPGVQVPGMGAGGGMMGQ
jgi:hypothetical protein